MNGVGSCKWGEGILLKLNSFPEELKRPIFVFVPPISIPKASCSYFIVKRYHESWPSAIIGKLYISRPRGSKSLKPVSLNQLLFHPKVSTLTFFISPFEDEELGKVNHFLEDMETQLSIQRKVAINKHLKKLRPQIKKILSSHPDKSHGFFISEKLQGYVILDRVIDTFCMIAQSFHVRPLLEELVVNPEYMVVNVSLYDIKIYRGDFQHVEIVQQYEFDQMPDITGITSIRMYSPQKNLIPYKTMLALRNIAQKIHDLTLYNSMPVLVTGLPDMKEIFLKNFSHSYGIFSQVDEDFYEKTCVEILEGCRSHRSLILEFYSLQLKEHLKKMVKSKRLLSDLGEIIKAASKGMIVHLILPTEKKLLGSVNFQTGEFEIHKRIKKNDTSIDILNELAEEVIKKGGKIQILGPHFFPEDAHVLAILRG